MCLTAVSDLHCVSSELKHGPSAGQQDHVSCPIDFGTEHRMSVFQIRSYVHFHYKSNL
jgi:hypothetical protein